MKLFNLAGAIVASIVLAVAALLLTGAQLALAVPAPLMKYQVPKWLEFSPGVAWSFQVTEAFVQAFSANFVHLAQQTESRLGSRVRLEPGIVGDSKKINRIGATAAQKRTTRHGDTPLIETPHSTRWIDLDDYEWADLVDELDKKKMLASPESDYLKAGVAAMNRSKDDVIYAAARGSARSSSGSVALTAGQKVAVAATGLTKVKIIATKKLFRANEADEENGETLYFTYGSEQMEDVLGDTTLTSSDFISVHMLQEGKVGKRWMGFEWVPFERAVKVTNDRFQIAWAKSGLALGVGAEIMTRLTERADKSYAMQPYARMSIGAVRVEEAKVVEVACLE
jgi:hypothetical protein